MKSVSFALLLALQGCAGGYIQISGPGPATAALAEGVV